MLTPMETAWNLKHQITEKTREESAGWRQTWPSEEGRRQLCSIIFGGVEMECVIIIGTQLFTSKGKQKGIS